MDSSSNAWIWGVLAVLVIGCMAFYASRGPQNSEPQPTPSVSAVPSVGETR